MSVVRFLQLYLRRTLRRLFSGDRLCYFTIIIIIIIIIIITAIIIIVINTNIIMIFH